jgi:hypothetical protein
VSFRRAGWVGGTGGATMKKRVSGYPRWRWRAGAVLCVGISLVILFLFKLQSLVLDNSLDDVLLTSHRDTSSTEYRNSTKPKLAFMFLARESMPLDILWQHFFEVRIITLFMLRPIPFHLLNFLHLKVFLMHISVGFI